MAFTKTQKEVGLWKWEWEGKKKISALRSRILPHNAQKSMQREHKSR
jgi:hypothetical protein